MKKKLFYFIFLLNFTSFSFASDLPNEINKCKSCHSFEENEIKNAKAPYMRNIVNNIKFKYKNKIDQKNFLFSFLKEPHNCSINEKVLCEKHSSEKYGLMNNIELTPIETMLIVNSLIDKY